MKETLFVSFSGGRTSGYMCHWLLENKANEYEFIFVFANTGLEHEKTLEFVDRCDKALGLNLTWVEAVVNPEVRSGTTHRIVNYDTAARNGEPFGDAIEKYGVPNATFPYCTRETKLRPMASYRRSLGFSSNHLTAIGIRSDEIDRISPTAKEGNLVYPLVSWTQTTEADVRHWWAKQPFDLDLPTYMGNCVTCWKKSDRKLWTIAKHDPGQFNFMDRMEKRYGKVKAESVAADDQDRVFFRKFRTAQDILREAQTPFNEFVDNMPPLQGSLFDPVDVEEDCGSGCEIQ